VLSSLDLVAQADTSKTSETIIALAARFRRSRAVLDGGKTMMRSTAVLGFSCTLVALGCASQRDEQPFAASPAQAPAAAGSGQVRATSGNAAQAALTITNGETDQAISGAQVTVAGRPFSSDASGQFAAPEPVLPDAPLEIVASGFIKRETLTRTDTRFALWPDRGGFPAGFTQELVYHPTFVQDGKLSRPTSGVFIVFSPEVDADGQAAMRDAAALLTAASGGRIPFSVGAAPPGAPTVTVKLDPGNAFFAQNPGAAAFAAVPFLGNVLGGPNGTLSFKDAGVSHIRSLAAHELGHHYGLGHPASQPAMMNAAVDPNRSDYTDAEKAAIKLMAQRRPGNAFPDNDRAVVGANLRRGVAVFGCELVR
jgi:hypothetical protein